MVELNEKAGKDEQRTICEACGKSNLAHDRAVWTDDGASFCPDCAALPAPDDGLEVVAWAQGAALDELTKHKDATATISSGLLPSPFGSPVALVRLSDAQAALRSKDEQIERLTLERDAELALAIANGSRAKEEYYRAETAEHQVQKLTAENERLRKAVTDLVDYVESNECHHEGVHRGGAIWTICDGCGAKWADDKGGFQPYQEPPELTAARSALETQERGK